MVAVHGVSLGHDDLDPAEFNKGCGGRVLNNQSGALRASYSIR